MEALGIAPNASLHGYVIDSMPDTTVVNGQAVTLLQVWCDPTRRDAHRDPALRAYIARLQMPAIVRFAQDDAVCLAPPALTVEGEWLEIPVNVVSKEAQAAKLAAIGARPFLDQMAASPPTVRFG